MAKKRHPNRAPVAPAPKPAEEKRAPVIPQVVQIAPRSWWFDFELERGKVSLLRFAFFAILAIDAFLQIAHAPRYGSDFNVEQLTWLPLPNPSRQIMLFVELVIAYLCTLAALGVATRVVIPIAAALDFYAYFSSQLDSYQHHYLVVLLLVIACFVPWGSKDRYVKSWALRLFCVQLAILYGWAAFAKMHPQWINGRTLEAQLAPEWIRNMLAHVPGKFATVACMVIATECFLAVSWCWPRLWTYALPVGVAFHISVEIAGFQIGQFSYVMLAVYTLMIPTDLARLPAEAIAKIKLPKLNAFVAMVIALGAGVALWYGSRVPEARSIEFAVSGVALVAYVLDRHWKVAAAHLAASLLVFTLARTTDQLLDYYRFWGHTAHLDGDDVDAKIAYQRVLDIDPDHANAHATIAEIDLASGDLDDAKLHIDRLLELRPDDPRTQDLSNRLQQATGATK